MNADRYGERGNAPESSVTYSDLNREDAKRDARIDARSELPVYESMLAKRGAITDRELLSRCRSAARLTAPEHVAPDHIDDVCATLAARHLDSIGRVSDERATLSFLCGEARNLYRSITTEINRLSAVELQDAANAAALPAALGIGPEDAQLAAMRAELATDDAYRTASALCRRLHFKAMPDTPVWLCLYGWLRDADSATIATERGMSIGAVDKARERGSAQFRERFTADALLSAISGDSAGSPADALAELLGVVVEITDGTRDARHHTPLMAGAPNMRQPECEASGRWTAHTGNRERYGHAMSNDQKRAAFKWSHSEYRARMYGSGQRAALTAEADRAPRAVSAERLLDRITD